MAGGGVWVFRKDGVMELMSAGVQPSAAAAPSKKALVYVPANETMRSLEALEQRLGSLGWERYYENRDIVQLHRRDGGVDLIALPRDFAKFRSTHMYDIVVKNRHHFKVVDI
ncbi:flowering-promoting factor 1-like protein 5 [Hordeum vulgare subsp. vulgare]|uniref:Flowering-promoting factor 1-like protein 1 n=1 Tax=Hordeum vulgare subsp. vulgare TaxID=112509 RepID=A0A8I6X0U1_HORVV|nr:flowering-promoting factor 1-like protein 5 [Hordeum vulgare subsp. vulgare]